MTTSCQAPAEPLPTILLADEDEQVRTFLADNLTADRYRVAVADCREKATAILSVEPVDVIIVDVNGATLGLIDALRSDDGLARHADPDTPVLVLTAHPDVLDRVRALDRGADDVLAKPFSYLELRARIAALLRRATMDRRGPRILRVGQLTIDLATRAVEVAGAEVTLAPKEFGLLRALATEPARVFTRQELLRDVWRCESFGTSRTLDSH
ncbi:MAG: response regulator transcription factor, partial [Solirubrobacteraceae bacterium]